MAPKKAAKAKPAPAPKPKRKKPSSDEEDDEHESAESSEEEQQTSKGRRQRTLEELGGVKWTPRVCALKTARSQGADPQKLRLVFLLPIVCFSGSVRTPRPLARLLLGLPYNCIYVTRMSGRRCWSGQCEGARSERRGRACEEGRGALIWFTFSFIRRSFSRRSRRR